MTSFLLLGEYDRMDAILSLFRCLVCFFGRDSRRFLSISSGLDFSGPILEEKPRLVIVICVVFFFFDDK